MSNEEGVSLGVYFDATLGGARLANNAAVLGERVRVSLCAELTQESRRSLHVGQRKVTVPVGSSDRMPLIIRRSGARV